MKTIIANWKSQKSNAELQEWWQTFSAGYPMVKSTEKQVVIAPSMVGVSVLDWQLKQTNLPNVMLGVQDLSPYPAGSYTGAISTVNLDGLSVAMAIVGHSERRRYFHETHQEIANKVDQALQAGIRPVVCVDRDYIRQQMAAIHEENWPQCVLAYEPLAAIGSGNEEPVDKVIPVVEELRATYKPQGVIYGGSVSPSTVTSYLSICDGVLVGSRSLDAHDFLSLVGANQ